MGELVAIREGGFVKKVIEKVEKVVEIDEGPICGPLTLEETERIEKEIREKEELQQKLQELAQREPSGHPRMTFEEMSTQLLKDLCPKVVFSLTPATLDNTQYTSVALYQFQTGRLTAIEVKAKRKKQKERCHLEVSLDPILGEPGDEIKHNASITLVNLETEKKIPVGLGAGKAIIYDVKAGVFSLEYNPKDRKVETLSSQKTQPRESWRNRITESASKLLNILPIPR